MPVVNQSERARLPGWMSGLLIAVVGGLAGGSLSYVATIQTLERQTNEARAAEDRELRREAYFNYADTAKVLGDAAEAAKDIEDPESATGRDAYLRYGDAFYAWNDAYNRMEVYVSDQAVDEMLTVVDALVTPGEGLDESIGNYDPARFDEAYDNLRAVMCEELPAKPRANCR